MYDPSLHHRKSIRLKDYDYSQPGLYFITICCHHNKYRFGRIINSEMHLNEYGLIAAAEWEKLPERYVNTMLDAYQIMPNHVHGIVHVTDETSPLADNQKRESTLAETDSESNALACGEMVGGYKSIVFNAWLEIFKSQNRQMGKLWQRNFYEHIIRNEKSYNTISNYIINNPASWNTDQFYAAE